MDRLWATWRMPYIDSLKGGKEGCIFCDKPKEEKDEETHILLRRPKSFVILNTFPYNPGHIMIAPFRHVHGFSRLDDGERGEIMDLLVLCEKALEDVFRPNGMNVGVNLGRSAGAGVVGHMHVHIVPRWQGDSNFMPVIGETKVIPQALADSAARLREALTRLDGEQG